METENKPNLIEENIIVTMNYSLTVDNEVVDSSEDGDPIVFLQGAGQIIPGLEKAINGLKIGDKKHIVVSPEEGYGEYDEESVVEVPKDEFPSDFPLEPGLEITVQSEEEDDEFEDDMMEATIIAVNDETVTLDFNHPLAGKTLNFDVEILDLREASEEEIEHGHVHGESFSFHFDDEDFEELDEEDSSNHKH